MLIEGGLRQSDLIHPEKLPELRELELMHPEKLPYEMQHQLERLIHGREGEWVRVGRPFARFYMTMLATELADSQGIALLTDLPASDRLAVNVRLDGKLGIPNLRMADPHWSRYGRNWRHERRMPGTLAPAPLADLTLQRIAVNPETSVDRILRFREEHRSELGRFRTKIADLTCCGRKVGTLSMYRRSVCNMPMTRIFSKLPDWGTAFVSLSIATFTGISRLAESMGPPPRSVASGRRVLRRSTRDLPSPLTAGRFASESCPCAEPSAQAGR